MKNTFGTFTIGLTLFFACGQPNKSNKDNEVKDSLAASGTSTTTVSKADDSFKGLQKNISKYNNSYTLGDTLTSLDNLWGSENTIDSIYLTKFKLVDTTFNSQFKPRQLEGYHCRFIGQYKHRDFLLILTYSLRTYAGDGNPLLILSVFTNNGILIDQMKTDLYGIHDPFFQPESRFSISKEFLITENQIEREFKANGDKLVLVRTKSDIKKYKVNDQGHFRPS